MSVGGEGQYVTSDLSLAAYLQERGLTLLGGNKGGAGGAWEFVLADPEGKAHDLAVDWTNSCCRSFESRVRSLKSLLHSGALRRGKQ
jgi:hypothetical protein